MGLSLHLSRCPGRREGTHLHVSGGRRCMPNRVVHTAKGEGVMSPFVYRMKAINPSMRRIALNISPPCCSETERDFELQKHGESLKGTDRFSRYAPPRGTVWLQWSRAKTWAGSTETLSSGTQGTMSPGLLSAGAFMILKEQNVFPAHTHKNVHSPRLLIHPTSIKTSPLSCCFIYFFQELSILAYFLAVFSLLFFADFIRSCEV